MEFNPPLVKGDDLVDKVTMPLDGEVGTSNDEGHGATDGGGSDNYGKLDV